jgi:BlaI family penicillinase repressor
VSQVPSIADSEWAVMSALWDGGPAAAGDVVARVAAAGHAWRPRTVKTLLQRLVKKGAVAVTVDGGVHTYRPKVTRAACVRREGRSFLDRVFGGAAGPAVVHFLEQSDLPPAEIDRLRKLLEAELAKARGPASGNRGGK